LYRQGCTRAAVLNQESVPLPIKAKVQIVEGPSATAGSSRSGTVPRTRPPTRNASRSVQNTSNIPRSAPNTTKSREPSRQSIDPNPQSLSEERAQQIIARSLETHRASLVATLEIKLVDL